jgi:hypothetical protein
MRNALVLVPVFLLAACGSLGTLQASKERRAQIADYERVVVGEFTADDDPGAEEGRGAFRAKIAEELRAVRAFDEVLLDDPGAPALKIDGNIEEWQVGNVAARSLVGFVGMSEFDATVVFSDLATGEELGRLKVNRNSWPLPIGTAVNVVQSVEFHMKQAARRIAHELAKAKGLAVSEPEAGGGR